MVSPGFQVHAVAHVLGRLDGKAAVGVDRALGTAGGAAGVDDHERVFGAGGFRGGDVGLLWNQLVPPVVTPGCHRRRFDTGAIDDEDVLHTGNISTGRIDRGLHRHDAAATQ